MTYKTADIFFDTDASDVVDKWFQAEDSNNTDDIDNLIRKSLLQSTNPSSSISNQTGHQGIGFSSHGVINKHVQDDLERRLLNKRKRQRSEQQKGESTNPSKKTHSNKEDKNDNDNNNNEDSEDEDMGPSRLDMISMKNQSKNKSTSQNNKKVNVNDQNMMIKGLIQVSTKIGIEPPVDTGSESKSNENVVKRKRKKTRSKQKNIRKDKRSENEKPSHLQFGSKEYRGRPLSKETKNALAIPIKSKTKTRKESDYPTKEIVN